MKLQFRPDLRIQIIAPDLFFIRDQGKDYFFRSKLLCSLAPLIQRKATVDDMVRELHPEFQEMEILSAVWLMRDKNYVVSRSVSKKRYRTQIEWKQLKSRKGTVSLAISNSFLHPEFESWNLQAIQACKSWMIAAPYENTIWLSPGFHPDTGACYNCMAMRLREGLLSSDFLKLHARKIQMVQVESIPVHSKFAVAYAVERMTRFHDQNHIEIRNSQTGKREVHSIPKFEHCPICGNSSHKPRMIQLHSCSARSKDGGYRSISPSSTFRKYQHHISRVTGIVSDLRSRELSRNRIHIYTAEHLFVPPRAKQELLRRGLRANSAGKGVSADQSKASALCEALERYSGIFRGDEFRITASYNDLQSRAIHINELLLFSKQQYSNRKTLNRSATYRDRIPEPLSPETRIEWSEVLSLTSNHSKFVPTAYCYYGHRTRSKNRICAADSNGNAAGNTLEEAILQGFLELVERDASAIWWFNRIKRPQVDFQSFRNPYVRTILNYYKSVGLNLWVLDITTDFDIPVFAAISADLKRERPSYVAGFGAHLDPEIAMTRALTELNQFVTRLQSGTIKSMEPGQIEFLHPAHATCRKARSDYKCTGSKDLRIDILNCVEIAKTLNMEILVLNQTRKDVAIPVVKVIVPGMRHIARRFGNGRLYDVPVKLGWLKKPLRENQLNTYTFLI